MSDASQFCARCGAYKIDRGRRWPGGAICQKCFQRAMRIHGPCTSCGQERLTPGLDRNALPICVDCAGIDTDFRCTRCGEEDEPVRRGLCAACCLRDDLTELLDDGTGTVKPELVPLLEALATQRNPRSARIWLTINPATTPLLKDLGTRVASLEHSTFTAHPGTSKVKHLRGLCAVHELLPEYNRDIEVFEDWLTQKLSGPYAAADRQLIRQYATWVHLKRMRELAAQSKLRPATILAARQSTNVGLQFLVFLRDRKRSPSKCTQEDIDQSLAEGPTTRSLARGFARWAMAQHHLPRRDFPYRVPRTGPVIGQPERLNWLRESVDDHSDLKPYLRAAVMLLLLFAQPLTRIAEMKLDQVDVSHDGTVTITGVGIDPIPVMAPFDRVFLSLLRERPNMNTAANAASHWLTPGSSPGRHLNPQTLMMNLRDAGIDLRGAKNAAIRRLVLEIPAALVADAFGHSY